VNKLGLNVGSGQRPFTSTPEVEWINVDKVYNSTRFKPDLICDGAHLPYADKSADYFVLHHVLEHFGCGEAKDLIAEAHRLLKPGGSLLVFVPNMRALAIRWLEGKMDTQTYMTSVYGAYMGDEEDRHKWGYDYRSLVNFMGELKWMAISPFDWREVPGMSAAKDFWIIEIEAIR